MSSPVAFFKEEGGLYHNDGLQKEDVSEGEALTLVETALGQSRSLAKAWSCQLCAVKLRLFSGFPSVIFPPGKEQGQLQMWSQIAYTQKKIVVLITNKPCWLFWGNFHLFFSILVTCNKNWL